MKRHLVLVVLTLTALLGNLSWAGSVRQDSTERLQNSADVLKEIAAAPDKGIPEEVVKNSKCIVVVPHLVKAGFIVGAKHGRGVAVCRTSDRMERARIHQRGRRKLGPADWRRGRGPGDAGDERQRSAAFAFQQV